jgi:protein-tyrosine-phosphatase
VPRSDGKSEVAEEQTVKVLIVCSGNTCRSPMAGAILAKVSRDANAPMGIETAGLYPGRALAPHAEAALMELELSAQPHRPRRVDGDLIASADVIVAVDSFCADTLRDWFPECSKRLWPCRIEVPDPLRGGKMADYREARDLLAVEMRRLLAWAKEKGGN